MPRPAPKILIVDDEASHVRALCDTLRDQGYDTSGRATGAEALAALREAKFELLLTDLSMPGIGGIELLAAGREIDPDLVVVMMSGSATIATAVEAMKAGALDYIAKPFRLSTILPLIARALDARRLRMRNAELERRVAEHTAALEAANLELAKLYNNVPCGLHSVDESGLIVRMNDTWLAWLGYRRDEVVGRLHLADLMIPESAEAYRTELFPLFKRQGRVRDVELEYVRKDGTTLVGLSSAKVVHDDDGRYLVSESSVIDVTQRRQSEAALRASEEYNRSIVQANQDCLIVLTCAGWLLSMTEQGRRLLEVDDLGRVENADWVSFWQDVERETVQAAVAVAREGGIGRFRGLWPTFAGAPKWWDVIVAPIRGPGGPPERLLAVCRDITEQIEIEKALARINVRLEERVLERTAELVERESALREKEALFRGILEAAADALIIADTRGRIVLANPAAGKIFGYSAAALAGMSIDDLVPPDARQRHAGLQAQYLAESATRAAASMMRKVEGLRADGSTVQLEITLSMLVLERGSFVIAAARDITDRSHIEQQLSQSQKMQAVGQLTGGVAHDFNNLLGVILGNLDLLERQLADNAPALKRVATAQKAAERGADLAQRLLAFSRRQPLKAEAVGLEGCVANVIEMARRTIGPDIAIQTAIAPGLPAVRADAAGLENVLLNLMINSRDAMPQGGTIGVAARVAQLEEHHPGVRAGELAAGRYMCVTLSDTGQGMSAQVLERAFEPFFTTKERGKGTGLGLAMVYGFVKQSGGHVSLYSEPGRGTTVTLYLPLAEPGAAAEPAALAESAHERIEATALVVDDEADLLEVAATYLEEMGFRVLRALDGPGALELLGREPGIELLLTDIMMPGGMNGVELARRARAARPGLRVLYATGYAESALQERAGIAADAPLLYKPYRHTEFAAAVRKVMADNAPGTRSDAAQAGPGEARDPGAAAAKR